MKKTTVATVKAFIRKHRASIMIRVFSSFDSMTDCVQCSDDNGFAPAMEATHKDDRYNMGINGVWFVRSGANFVSPLFEDGAAGFEVSNCCGKWAVAIKA